jgi:ribosomal protein S18 acetylase RimI-like enzyme
MRPAGIRFQVDDTRLTAEDFLQLAQSVWPGNYDAVFVQEALAKTLNVTAWDGTKLVGCARILTDGYFFGTVPEILVAPEYQHQGIGLRLMALAWEASPTSLFFGAQPGNENFFEKAGFTKSIQSFARKKARRST